jgi:hypothetical protein
LWLVEAVAALMYLAEVAQVGIVPVLEPVVAVLRLKM